MDTIQNNAAKDRAFKNAQSHSRRVRWVKRTLPVLALGIIGMIGGAVFVSRVAPSVALALPDSTIIDGKLVMSNPKLDGFTSDDRPYSVTATRAIQDLSGQTALELVELRADVEMKNGANAKLTSPTGTFDSDSDTLVLPNKAILVMSDGMRAVMGQADINIKTGSVDATKSVKISNEKSTIVAKSMQIEGGGKRILFEDNVRLVLKPNAVDKGVVETQ